MPIQPIKAFLYDEWGEPLSSEPQYFASKGAALKAQAQMDAKIAAEKEKKFAIDPRTGRPQNTPLSRGDYAAAQDASGSYYDQQEDSMYNALMGMISGGGSSGMGGGGGGGGWTPGSTMVGGSGGGGDSPAVTGGARPGPGASPAAGGRVYGGGGTTTQVMHGDKNVGTVSYGGVGANPKVSNEAEVLNTKRFGNPKGLSAALDARKQQDFLRSHATPSNSGVPSTASAPGTPMVRLPNGQVVPAGGATPTGGSGGGSGGGTGGGTTTGGSSGGQNFGAAFEQSLYESFTKPGWDPEPVINKGTDEIAQGESNAMQQLQASAAAQGIEGGAVQGANREVLSDFAGKRATLARDTRSQAAREAEQSRQQALSSAGNYLGRAQDNARQDRNQMMQLLMQQMQSRRQRAPDFSAAIQAPRPTIAPIGGMGSNIRGGDQEWGTSVTRDAPVSRPGPSYSNPGGRYSPSQGRNI